MNRNEKTELKRYFMERALPLPTRTIWASNPHFEAAKKAADAFRARELRSLKKRADAEFARLIRKLEGKTK